jgi:hypothetical protein
MEGKTYIAYSPVLDLSTSADSFEKAQKRFQEIVMIFFEELIQKGTLDEVLSDLGWKKIKREWNAPIPLSHQIQNVTIPLSC